MVPFELYGAGMRGENGVRRKNGTGKKTDAALCLLILAAVLGLIWLIAPKRFLQGMDPSRVDRITVFSGMTGKGFTVEEPDKIAYIVESFQNTAMRRSGLSLGKMGYGYRITFLDREGRILASLILNSASTVRRDPFFYEPEKRGLCYEYLQELERAEE